MSRKRTKQYLMLLVVIGLVSIASGGSGTFASFTAETANSGNVFATGTLYLHDKVGAGNTCTSESSALNQNVPPTVAGANPGDACDLLFNFPSTTDYSTPQTVDLTLSNAGSLAASDLKFQLNGAGCIYTDTVSSGVTLASALTPSYSANGTGLSSDVTTGGAVTSLPVNALTRVVYAGSTVTLDDGTNTDNFTVSADAQPGATSISVNSHTPAFNFLAATPTNVLTVSPITSLPITGSTTSSILSGAAVQLRQGGTTTSVATSTHYQTFTTSGAVPYGHTGTIAINSAVPNFAYSSGNTVYAAFGPNAACASIPYTITETNSTFDGPSEGVTTGNINGTTGTTDTFEGCAYGTAASNGCVFDQANNIAGIPTRSGNSFASLTLSSGGGTGNATHLTGLDPGGARYFIITVFPQFGDPVMGQTAAFDMVWHMDQA